MYSKGVSHPKRLFVNKSRCLLIFLVSFFIVGSVVFLSGYNPHFVETFRYSTFDENLKPLTMHCNGGRLGNQMCTLASLYGLCKLNNRKPELLPCNYEKLVNIFDLQLPVVTSWLFKEKNPFQISTYLRPGDAEIKPDTNIVKGYLYPCSYTFFDNNRDEIRQLFRFQPHIKQFANQALANVSPNRETHPIVGVHVRRGDFLPEAGKSSWLKAFDGRVVDLEYFDKATKYFRAKYPNAIFVAVSEDRPWCRTNLGQFGITILDDVPSAAHDMAILANCDHVIMTYGTFGFWSGYLSGGEVVYFDKFLKPGTAFTTTEFIREKMYLPEWKGIETNSSFNYDS